MARRKSPVVTPPRRDAFAAAGWTVFGAPRGSIEAKRIIRIAMPTRLRRRNHSVGRAEFQEVQLGLAEVALLAMWGLYEDARADQNAVHDKLADLEVKLLAAREALAELGSDATTCLRRRAELQERRPEGDRGGTIWQHVETPGFSPSGDERIKWVDRVLEDCSSWAQAGAKEVGRRPAGRPARNDVARALFDRLAGLWEKLTGETPSLKTVVVGTNAEGKSKYEKSGPFVDFCNAVAGPIWKARGLKLPNTASILHEMSRPPGRRQQAGNLTK